MPMCLVKYESRPCCKGTFYIWLRFIPSWLELRQISLHIVGEPNQLKASRAKTGFPKKEGILAPDSNREILPGLPTFQRFTRMSSLTCKFWICQPPNIMWADLYIFTSRWLLVYILSLFHWTMLRNTISNRLFLLESWASSSGLPWEQARWKQHFSLGLRPKDRGSSLREKKSTASPGI
jgi:hypothetical protein